jgi:hypothetical protein
MCLSEKQPEGLFAASQAASCAMTVLLAAPVYESNRHLSTTLPRHLTSLPTVGWSFQTGRSSPPGAVMAILSVSSRQKTAGGRTMESGTLVRTAGICLPLAREGLLLLCIRFKTAVVFFVGIVRQYNELRKELNLSSTLNLINKIKVLVAGDHGRYAALKRIETRVDWAKMKSEGPGRVRSGRAWIEEVHLSQIALNGMHRGGRQ